MLTQIVAGRVYDYSHVVGRYLGPPGFNCPVQMAIGESDVVYVLNRGYGYHCHVAKITIGIVPGDEEYLAEFSKFGNAEGDLTWPVGIALDSQENFYVTDEWHNRVSSFDKEGNLLSVWGSPGGDDGEFNRPSGIAIDRDDNLYIVDSLNHRVQKYTKDGKFLAKWGRLGSDDGELNSPWGITVDHQGYVYVADHSNHRAQKFTPEGEYVAQFGSHGTGGAKLNRPTDVAVDPDGDVYVCDWANNRVQAFGPDGRFITSLIGDAQELSKWAKLNLESNPDMIKRRREVRSLEPEWRFTLPRGVVFDARKGRLLVVDTQNHRIQIYNKLKDYQESQRNL